MCSGLPYAHYVLVEMLGTLPTRVAHSAKMAIGFCLPKDHSCSLLVCLHMLLASTQHSTLSF